MGRAKRAALKSALNRERDAGEAGDAEKALGANGLGAKRRGNWYRIGTRRTHSMTGRCRKAALQRPFKQVSRYRGDWIRTSDRSAPSRVRYQTALRPVALQDSPRGPARELDRRAGDGNRTRPRSLEGSCATTTLRPPEAIDYRLGALATHAAVSRTLARATVAQGAPAGRGRRGNPPQGAERPPPGGGAVRRPRGAAAGRPGLLSGRCAACARAGGCARRGNASRRGCGG